MTQCNRVFISPKAALPFRFPTGHTTAPPGQLTGLGDKARRTLDAIKILMSSGGNVWGVNGQLA